LHWQGLKRLTGAQQGKKKPDQRDDNQTQRLWNFEKGGGGEDHKKTSTRPTTAATKKKSKIARGGVGLGNAPEKERKRKP